MTKIHGIHVFMLLLIGMLLSAGCTMSPPAPVPIAENQDIPGAPNLPNTTELPVTSLAPVQCPQESNSTFIRINPIPDHYLGDNITIEGTTNLAPGEMIQSQIYEPVFHTCPKFRSGACDDSVYGCCGGISQAVTVRAGECGINTWSLDVNTSQHQFSSDSFIISAYKKNFSVEDTRLFNVLKIPEPDPFHYIIINVPENDPSRNAITLSGKVNGDNGPREKLFVRISLDSGARINSTIPVVFDGTGYIWNYTIEMAALYPLNNYSVNITSVQDPRIGNRSVFTI
jgi:hypothetical protein